ncbi:uncharacterized protein [Parasteatoda tepidariorum]|uniref:uncharacterized protein isoform X2 n=1 Tax=Parasteatoda tepidariorum TaxID=114398 RepID=UPI0039BD6013
MSDFFDMEEKGRNETNDKDLLSSSLEIQMTKVLRKNSKAGNAIDEIFKPTFVNFQRFCDNDTYEKNVRKPLKGQNKYFSENDQVQKTDKCSNALISCEKSPTSVHSSVEPVELRRTSRRIVHRVKKDFVLDEHGSTTSTLSPNNAVSSAFSPQFQSYLQTSYYPKSSSREIKNFSFKDQDPFIYSSHKVDDLNIKTSKIPAIHQGFNDNQLATSSKPTVIYFKFPKNCTKVSSSRKSKHRNVREDISNSQITSYEQYRETTDKIYLQQKYGMIDMVLVDYFYSISQGNIQQADLLLRRYMYRELELLPCDFVYPFSKTQHLGENNEDIRNTWSNGVLPESDSPVFIEIDTLNRQVIVDSIRILYDEESVLEY